MSIYKRYPLNYEVNIEEGNKLVENIKKNSTFNLFSI